MSYFGSILKGFKSLLTGLKITLRESFRKPVTLQYPHEKPELNEAYRSLIAFTKFQETGTHDCVACYQCEKICPSYCIKLDGGKVEGIKRKRATMFEVDFALCSLCGLCIDVCPTDTLEYSKYYDEAGFERQWVYDLLDPFLEFEPQFIANQKVVEEKEAAAKVAKKEAMAKAKAEAQAKAEAEAPKPDDDSSPAPGEKEAES